MSTPTVLITGASGGIGTAAAKRFAAAGANLILHAHQNLAAAAALQTEIQQAGAKAELLAADLSQPNGAETLLQLVSQKTRQVDILVNAAGLDLMAPALSALSFEQKLQRMLQTDVVSPILLSKTIGQRMKDQERGTLFFLSWNGIDYGWQGETAQLYGTAKGALLGFSRSLAEDLAPQVIVRCLSLGWIRTRWGEKLSEETAKRYAADSRRHRWGTPEDVAAAIVFLSSKESAYIDGIGLRIDGEKKGTAHGTQHS